MGIAVFFFKLELTSDSKSSLISVMFQKSVFFCFYFVFIQVLCTSSNLMCTGDFLE